MTKAQFEVFEALNPFFEVVMEGLSGLVVTPQHSLEQGHLDENGQPAL